MEPATGIVAKVVLELFREVVLPHNYCLRCWLNLAWTIFYEAGASDCMLHDCEQNNAAALGAFEGSGVRCEADEIRLH